MMKKINRRLITRITFISLGVASTVWFLFRVIPKPSRAGYPCMKAVAPIMSSFITYLLAISGSSFLIRRGFIFYRRHNSVVALAMIVTGIAIFLFSPQFFTEKSYASPKGSNPGDYPANIPYGEGVGVNPGRVTWTWDPAATDEDCTNAFNDPLRGEDGYFMEKNNNRQVIGQMLDDNVIKLTGAPKISASWDSLFTDFNRRKGLGDISYQGGQQIFIKINQGGGGWLTNSNPDDDLSFIEEEWAMKWYGISETSPIIVIELLDQLVNGFGIEEDNIYVGDPMSHIYKHNYDMMYSQFPSVKYVDKDPDHADIGRTILTPSSKESIIYSDKGSQMPDAISDKLYLEMENADYLINIASLKAHALAGITLGTKNHFGSHTRESATHLHAGLVATSKDKPTRDEYGMYRVHTDLMGHKSLGGNTVLFIVDGLWGGPEATEMPVKWNTAPFNGDWPNSLLVSQDQVALESVCFDFLRNEFSDPAGVGAARPWMGAVDDYLHQASDKQFWPDGIIYDPENDGIPIASLGVHEHWNNETDRKYSRNLGYDYGLELLPVNKTYEKSMILAKETRTAPAIDGKHLDRCWIKAEWNLLNHLWMPPASEIDSSDYYGRYQVSWSETENLLYYYVEINDDVFVEGYDFPGRRFNQYDILEIFLDEDLSGGYHAFDDELQRGSNAENAFTYHIAVNSPPDDGYSTDFKAFDIRGYQWGDHIIDYSSHFEEFIMKREGNLSTYEFSLKVYNDQYEHDDREASSVLLFKGKEIGLSLAYSENDLPGTIGDHYYGSVWVPEEASRDHWYDADYFGVLKLSEEGPIQNQAIGVLGDIPDFEISNSETELLIHGNLMELFDDPDGDPIEFSVNCDEDLLSFTIIKNELRVKAGLEFEGERLVTLIATDGEFEASIEFGIIAQNNVIVEKTQVGPGISCYPNPFFENLHLEFESEQSIKSNATVGIYNMRGQLVHSETIELFAGSRTVKRIEMPKGSPGIYILELRTEGETYSRVINKK